MATGEGESDAGSGQEVEGEYVDEAAEEQSADHDDRGSDDS